MQHKEDYCVTQETTNLGKETELLTALRLRNANTTHSRLSVRHTATLFTKLNVSLLF